MSNGKNTPPGPGVDASGQAVIDPTDNVKNLFDNTVKRLDDLRDEATSHTRDIMALRSMYEEKLRIAESDRIDAIRAVDVGAAAILANQVSASAEALRAQVEATRVTTAQSLAAALEPIQKDIADLRRVQYEQQGQKSAVIEKQSSTVDSRTIIVGILGVLATAALIVSPHIH